MTEEEALQFAKDSYRDVIFMLIKRLHHSIRESKKVDNFPEFLRIKRDAFILLLNNFPRGSSSCPYCLYHTNWRGECDCDNCNYATEHKRCALDGGSDYRAVYLKIKELIEAVNKCWTQHE